MFRLSTLIIIVAAVVMLITNPNLEAHKKVVAAKLDQEASHQGLLRRMAVDIMGSAGLYQTRYDNYYVFSTVSVDDKLTTIGCFGRVWPWNLPKASLPKQAPQTPSWPNNATGS